MKKAFTQRRLNDQSHFVHKPYQFNYWIVFISIFLFCGMSSYSFPNIASPSSAEQVNTWTLIQSTTSPGINGVDVYYQEYVVNSSTYLKFKIVNSTANSVNFHWMLSKDSDVLYQNTNQVVQANNEVLIDETIYVVPFSSNDNISYFNFEIMPN